MYENRKFMIIPTSEIFSIDFSEVFEEEESLRYSLDKTKTFIKWEGDIPRCLISNLHVDKEILTYSKILTIIQGKEWSELTEKEKDEMFET